MVKLSIIILSYNTKDLTVRCIESLINQYDKQLDSGEFEIILTDNASTDGTIEKISNLKSYTSNIRIIQNKENYGFSKGNNIAFKNAKGKYILFLNSDTQVKDKGFLDMINFLNENSQIAVLGARVLNADGSSQPSSGKFYNLFNLFLVLIGGERLGLVRLKPNKITRVDWVSGVCMMIRFDVFKKIKGFDENLFMYMDDIELCFRVKESGYETYFYPNLNIVHSERGSSDKTFAILNIYKGILYFYKKHKPLWEYYLVKLLLNIKAITAFVIGTIIGDNYLKKTYKQALKF